MSATHTEITTTVIERAFGEASNRKLRAALGRWHRSKKDWADRQMLINAVLAHFGRPDADSEDRVELFHVIRSAARKTTPADASEEEAEA